MNKNYDSRCLKERNQLRRLKDTLKDNFAWRCKKQSENVDCIGVAQEEESTGELL